MWEGSPGLGAGTPRAWAACWISDKLPCLSGPRSPHLQCEVVDLEGLQVAFFSDAPLFPSTFYRGVVGRTRALLGGCFVDSDISGKPVGSLLGVQQGVLALCVGLVPPPAKGKLAKSVGEHEVSGGIRQHTERPP